MEQQQKSNELHTIRDVCKGSPNISMLITQKRKNRHFQIQLASGVTNTWWYIIDVSLALEDGLVVVKRSGETKTLKARIISHGFQDMTRGTVQTSLQDLNDGLSQLSHRLDSVSSNILLITSIGCKISSDGRFILQFLFESLLVYDQLIFYSQFRLNSINLFESLRVYDQLNTHYEDFIAKKK